MSDVSAVEPVYSFAATLAERHERQQRARGAVGLRLAAVRYVDIDYRRDDIAPDHHGWREIVDAAEWHAPTWRYDGFDAIDYGLELQFTGGRAFTVTWDSPGKREDIGIRETSLAGYAVAEEAAVAVWDVTARSGWAKFANAVVPTSHCTTSPGRAKGRGSGARGSRWRSATT